MKQYNVRIEKILDEVIEAENEDEALDIAWEMFSQSDEEESFIEVVG